MQFLIGSLALMAATVSGLPQPVAQEPAPAPAATGYMTPQEAAAQAKMSLMGTNFAAQTNKLLTVVVGGTQLTYMPNSVTAAVGDVVQFQFNSGNHTVTQSSEVFPCQPLQVNGAVNSGHLTFAAGQAGVSTFNMPVTSTTPMFIYCATGPHCQLGMVMVINPTTPDQLVSYAENAAAAPPSGEARGITGGAVAQIAVSNASFRPAAAPAAAAPPAAPAPSATTPAPATPAAPGTTTTEVIVIVPAGPSAPAASPTEAAPAAAPTPAPPAASPTPVADPPAGPPNFPNVAAPKAAPKSAPNSAPNSAPKAAPNSAPKFPFV